MDTATVDRVDIAEQGWTIREAALAYGLSEKTIRRRIKSGTLSAFQITTQYGVEWRVTSLDTSVEGTPTQQQRVQGRRVYTGRIERVEGGQPRPPMDMARVDTPNNGPLQHALELAENSRRDAERLQQQNVELAGRCGYLQARLEAAEKQVLTLSPPAETQQGGDRAPWWRRLLGMEPA
jgi:hypothetical protein